MKGKYDIYIYEDGGAFYTRPPVVAVEGGNGKKLKVRNLTGRTITLTFPPGVVTPATITVRAHKKGQVDIDPAADGIYDYSVQVRLTSTIQAPALGNSWPKIIVDP